MAKKDLELLVKSDPTEAMAAMAKTVTSMEGVISKLKETNRTAKGSGDIFDNIGKKLGNWPTDIAKMAAGWVSAQGAIGAFHAIVSRVKMEFEDLLRKEKEFGDDLKRDAETYTTIFARWVGPGRVEEARGIIEPLIQRTKTLTDETGAKIVRAYTGTRPNVPITEAAQALQLAAGAIPWEDPEQLAKLAGHIKKIFPEGKNLEDIFDIAVKFRRDFQEKADELSEFGRQGQKLLEVTKSPEDVLAMVYASFETEQGLRPLGALAGFLTKDIKPITRKISKKKPLTAEEELQNRLASMTPKERFNWLTTAQAGEIDLMDAELVKFLPVIRGDRFARARRTISEAQRFDEYGRAVGAAAISPTITQARLSIEQKAAMDKIADLYRTGGERAIVREWVTGDQGLLARLPEISKTERQLITGAVDIESRILGKDYIKSVTERLRAAEQKFATKELPFTPIPGYGYAPGPQQPSPSPYYNPELANVVNELISRISQLDNTIKTLNRVAENTVPPAMPETE